jgi:diguanylate cyclase (GGDEF)-like protein
MSGWRRRLQHVDHYYWLTAFLSAREMRTRTCRVVAAIILTLGTIPVTLMATAPGPLGLPGQFLAFAVMVCCLVMGSLWLRRWWPTRTESQLCVLIGTVCIAVACLIEARPVVGLLGSATFAVLGAFVAFFHSGRLLAFTWSVGAVTIGLLAVRLAAADTELAVCIVIIAVLLNVFVAFICRMAIRLIETEVDYDEIEPLTGLLDRKAFFDRVATLIGARGRGADHHLVLLVANLDSFSLITGMNGVAGGNRARVAVAQLLRETARRDAIVAHVGDAEFLIAEPFTTPDPSPFVNRVRGAITSPPCRLTASIGVVSTPLGPLTSVPPYDLIEELLTIATAGVHEARRSGGNQVRLVIDPPLSVLDQPDAGEWPVIDQPA